VALERFSPWKEVHRRVARILVGGVRGLAVPWLEALEASRGLDQGPVHREMLVREQVPLVGLSHDQLEQRSPHLVVEQPLTILGERRRIEAWFHQLHVQEPAEQEVVVEFLTEGSLTPHRIKRDQERRLEQPLRRDRRSAVLGVHRVEGIRQCGQCLLGERLNRAQRMVLRYPLLQVDKGQHRHLGLAASTHPCLPVRDWHVVPQHATPPVAEQAF
jgi:hypothetical protein